MKAKKAVLPPPTFSSLPPDLVSRVFGFLPVADLARVAQVSRRTKILSYADEVFLPKLRSLGVSLVDPLLGGVSVESGGGGAEVDRLATRLKQLPGGGGLVSQKYLETGSLFAATGPGAPSDDLEATDLTLSVSSDAPSNTATEPIATTSTSAPSSDPAIAPSASASTSPSGSTANVASPSSAGSPTKKISSALPVMKKSAIVVGAGGLKAAGKTNSGLSIGGGGGARSKSPSASKGNVAASTKPTATANGATFYPHLRGLRPRDAFKLIYVELLPYYLDFRTHAKDSKVFRDHKDMVTVSQLLCRISKFAKAKLILDTDDINFSLETTMEWYESMLLGQFERAYDAKQITEMKRNATACFELNGGASCVQLFCAKNPIFFDHTFNPSLVASKLPSLATSSAEVRGYALADDFALFIDHTLESCSTQATVVGQVFNPAMDAMTIFVSKVFEDSIAEYLVAVLTVARDGEGIAIYLHTLATSVHACDQFLGFISTADARVTVKTDLIRDAMRKIFAKDWEKYMIIEMDHLVKRMDAELKKWNNRKARSNAGSPDGAASYLTDAEKAMAHKREVMSTFKKVLFAPVALGKSVGIALMGNKAKGQTESLLGSESNSPDSPIPTMQPNGGASIAKDTVTYHLDDGSLGSLVSLELCLNLMHMSKESLGRVLVITAAIDYTQLKANAGRVFVKLLEAIGEGHMNPAFSSAIARLESAKPVDNWSEKAVNIESLQFFELVHIADLVHQMLDVYFAEDVRPWIDENDFLSDVMIEKKKFDRSSDDNVAHGMDKAIQVLIEQVDHILDTTQLPTDYNPTNENHVYDFKPTKACLDVIACLNAHTRLLNGVTNKDTLELFFGEVGVRLFNVICKNLKKRQVSPSGALQLICDMNKYHEWATTLRVASVPRLFLVLKELGALFMADGGDELRNLVHDTERYQGALPVEEIYELLASRTDYKKIQKFVEAKECIVM